MTDIFESLWYDPEIDFSNLKPIEKTTKKLYKKYDGTQDAEIMRLYSEGMSIEKIFRATDISRHNVKKALLANEVELVKHGCYIRKKGKE